VGRLTAIFVEPSQQNAISLGRTTTLQRMQRVLIPLVGAFAIVAADKTHQSATLDVTVVGCVADTLRTDTFAVGSASIRISGRTEQATSDSSGFYRLAISAMTSPVTLEFRRIGYRSQTFPVPYAERLVRMPTLFVAVADDFVTHRPIAVVDSQREHAESDRRKQQARRLRQMCQRSVETAHAPAP
jgi:hypothetical protein